MATSTVTSKSIILNYGVVLGIISVLFGAILYATNNHIAPHWSLGVLSGIISVIIMIQGIRAFKKSNEGFLKLKQALKVGIGIALISGLLNVVWTVVVTQVLDKEYVEKSLTKIEDDMYDSYPNITSEQVDMQLGLQEKLLQPAFMIPASIIAAIFFGFIVSLIAGLVMKKESPFENIEQ